MKLNATTVRILSVILLFAIFLTSTPISVLSSELFSDETVEVKEETPIAENCPELIVLHNGAEKQSVSLKKNAEETLSVFTSEINTTKLSWQLLIPDSNTWVNIEGQNRDEIKVSYSLVGSMLNDSDCAYIRAVVSADDKAYYSESVEIKLTHDVEDDAEETSSPLMFSRYRIAPTADDSDLDLETVSIVINYIFDNGGIAFEPYGASVAKGSDFVKSVTSPTIVGYDPFIRSDGNYIDASVVEINLTNITENVTIDVIYEPAIVDFQIHHHLQDLYDDDYSLHADFITYGKGLTGSLVPSGLELGENDLPGFTPLAYEAVTIAADGSTVVEIRYNRNYYLINFDMNGGYGTEPVYTRYGSAVGANPPIQHGYVFEGWELISYGDSVPTTEQASMYDINSTTITVPSANLTYRARWKTQLTKYTMVFWKENIDDNGFSYWGSLDGLTAMSGSTVSGADRIREVGGIDDEDCFTYNDTLTDKDVLVEGDGSTILNVYYTRNRYTITFRATGKCVIPVGHTHTDACYQLLCTKDHTHTDECNPTLDCNIPLHESHTDECIACGKIEHAHGSSCCGQAEHTHIKSCYNSVGSQSTPADAPTGVESGYIYSVKSGWRYSYYICISGVWYSYNGKNVSSGDIVSSTCRKTEHVHGSEDCSCTIEQHSHVDTCYLDSIHIHDANNCYSYSCGYRSHVHSEGCRILHCGIPEKHSHSGTCTSSYSTNTVKLVYKKYQENLEEIWPIVDDNGKSYNSGERWSPSGSDTFSAVLVYIANMPGENFTLTLSTSNAYTFTMNYYLEVLDGDPYDVTYNKKNYKLYTTIKANYNYITKAEDFFDINGFYQNGSNPAFRNDRIEINGGGTVNFYYGRIVDHYLEFQNNGIIVSDKTQYGIPYGQVLTDYYFVPEYPVSLEPGAFEFAGWYTSPGHYDGTEVDWDTITMDAGDVMLYAKWAPITHSIKVYRDDSLTEQIGSTQYVSHGNFAHSPTETVTNGNYIFQGWFYREIEDGVSVEKAFVFTGIPILRDMQIYAKWSSHVTVDYTINYVLLNTNEVIAPPQIGSSIAGHNKTFYAKTGDDLNAGFREGYYPLTSSHTVTMSAESDHEFTFYYIYVESMPYLVRYLDSNGTPVAEEKRVMDNNLSVVTETFVKVPGMMPDAYQKRLVLSASDIDADDDGIYDSNVITFNYSSDSEHAYYQVVHYIENISGNGYREYRSEDAAGTIGESYRFEPISMTGFSFNGQKTMINGVLAPTSDSAVTAELTSEGLLVELYYDRVDVSYTVRYLESGTNKVLYAEKIGEGIFGEQIVEYAPGLTHIGYTLVSDSVKQIHLAANESVNIIDFYYQETIYSIKYQIVGSPEGATLSLSSENILAVSGVPTGSIPQISNGYHFVGWFYDEACTSAVPAEWVDDTTYQITPRNDGVWLASHTYYAQVDPDFASLTINTVGCADVDDGQIFIFRITGTSDLTADVDVTVTVVGNSSVTIDELPVGGYLVTEVSSWSYRYTPDAASKTITLSVISANNRLTFSQVRSSTKWLDDNDNEKYIYN